MATCLATVPAGSARAAEPFDTEVANLLVAPGDPAFVEIADPADPAHSGPLDAVRLGTLAAGRSAARTPIRGGAVRGFADGSGHRLVEIGYDLTNGTNARQAVEAHRSLGTTFAVQGIPGAVGVVMPRQPGSAALAFSMGSRTFLLVLGGDDPGHALLQDQALQVANAAAEDLAGSLTAASAGGAPASTASGAATKPAATASDAGAADGATAAGGLVARARRVLHGRDVQLALAAVAAVALWLLVRSSQRRHRPAVAAPPAMRGSSQAWQQVGAWGGNPAHWSGGAAADSFVTSGPPAAMALGGPVAAEVDGADAYYWGERQVGWGDEPDEAAPPLTRRVPAASGHTSTHAHVLPTRSTRAAAPSPDPVPAPGSSFLAPGAPGGLPAPSPPPLYAASGPSLVPPFVPPAPGSPGSLAGSLAVQPHAPEPWSSAPPAPGVPLPTVAPALRHGELAAGSPPAAGQVGPPTVPVWTSPAGGEIFSFPGAPSWPEDAPPAGR